MALLLIFWLCVTGARYPAQARDATGNVQALEVPSHFGMVMPAVPADGEQSKPEDFCPDPARMPQLSPPVPATVGCLPQRPDTGRQ